MSGNDNDDVHNDVHNEMMPSLSLSDLSGNELSDDELSDDELQMNGHFFYPIHPIPMNQNNIDIDNIQPTPPVLTLEELYPDNEDGGYTTREESDNEDEVYGGTKNKNKKAKKTAKKIAKKIAKKGKKTKKSVKKIKVKKTQKKRSKRIRKQRKTKKM